jgi:hypothetical protein
MTRKADFNAEEWSTVVEAPMLAGMRIVTADRGGTIRESMAIGQTYQAARQRQDESELLDELVASPPAMSPGQISSAEQLQSMSQERLREATRLLDEKATAEEVDAYKRFALTLAETAARAHKEGGFLGIGGKEVSDKEQVVLDELAAELGLDSPGS